MYESLITINEAWAQEIVQKIEPNIQSLTLVADQFKGLRNLVASLDVKFKLRDDVINLLDGPVFPERSNRGRPTTSLDKKEEKLELAYEKKAVLRNMRA